MSPVVRLKNGVRIANFSSPHEFKFDDGTVLPACTPERAKLLMLESEEVARAGGKWTDIELVFKMSRQVDEAIDILDNDLGVDVILVPFPVLEAIKRDRRPIGKCRVCRVADRVAKTIFSDKFCI